MRKRYAVPLFAVFVLLIFMSPVRAADGDSPAPRKWGLWSDPQAEPIPAVQESAADSSPAELLPPVQENDAYLIGAGDQLDISVWKDEALTRTVAVLPDGKISFPLVGELAAEGKTVAQLKGELEARLARFIPELVLSLDVRQVNSLLVYVIGRVNSPGRFVLNSNVNVLQALALAGGVNPFASPNKIKILRREGDSTRTYPFRYDDVVYENRLQDNIALKRGDVIVVP